MENDLLDPSRLSFFNYVKKSILNLTITLNGAQPAIFVQRYVPKPFNPLYHNALVKNKSIFILSKDLRFLRVEFDHEFSEILKKGHDFIKQSQVLKFFNFNKYLFILFKRIFI